MRKVISIPHKSCAYTCYVNGVEDVLAWKGAVYTDYLLPLVGGMASFAYLKSKRAKPPCMVFWGNNPKYLLRSLEKIIGFTQSVSEGKSFKTMFTQIKESIDRSQPVMAGALDMYYLHYYPDIYKQQHIPIHYFLVVGYDDEKQSVHVHDCGRTAVQHVPYAEFEKALNVKVAGMSRKNTFRTFKFPNRLPSELEVARKGFVMKAEQMLKPRVRMFGIPAMRKLVKEITTWKSRDCFEHLITYATTPPQLPSNYEHSDGMRQIQANVLMSLGEKYSINEWVNASKSFKESAALIKKLCMAAAEQDAPKCSKLITQIAGVEEEAYSLLKTAS